jgi:hypothetical protein
MSSVFCAILSLMAYLLVNSSTAQPMMGTPTPTPTPASTANNGVILLGLIGAAIIVAIAAIAIYYFYSKNKNKRIEPVSEPKSTTVMEKTSTCDTKTETRNKDTRPFTVFLCYKKSSGKDYADHLKNGLEELGLHTFEDCKDIPLTVETEEGWARTRDKALEESKFFVLIMTPGFELSPEVVKEIGMARKQGNKTFVFFRHRSMKRNIVVNLGNEILDIGKLEQVSFESKEELMRLAHNIILKA